MPALPAAPALDAVALSTSSIKWFWNAAAYAAGYRVLSSTGANISGNLGASTTYWIETTLAANAPYTRRVSAFNDSGPSVSAVLTRYSLAIIPAAVAVVSVSSLTLALSWSANGNPAQTQYQVDYWAQAGSTSSVTVAAASATLANLTDYMTYFLAVQAVNGDGVLTVPTQTVSTVTAPCGGALGLIGAEGGTLRSCAAGGPVELLIPPGSFTQMEQVTLSPHAGPYPAASSAASIITAATGIGVDIDVSPHILPLKQPRLLMSYNPTHGSSLDPKFFIIARYDEGRNVWVPFATSVDQTNGQVAAMIDHFSTFQIVQSQPADTVSTFKVFPNPLRPAVGHLFMTFSMLPESARVRVYTLSGVLVRDITADAGGVARWDGTNESGAKAASGVYFVVVQTANRSQTFKVAVQR